MSTPAVQGEPRGAGAVTVINDHRPIPGPMHWDWRCLRCDGEVAHHRGWLAYWLRNRMRRRQRP